MLLPHTTQELPGIFLVSLFSSYLVNQCSTSFISESCTFFIVPTIVFTCSSELSVKMYLHYQPFKRSVLKENFACYFLGTVSVASALHNIGIYCLCHHILIYI